MSNFKFNRKLVIVFLIFLITHFCFQLALHRTGENKNIIIGDGIDYYSILRSVVMDGDVYFGNEYERFGLDLSHPVKFHEYVGEGRYKNIHSVGPAIFWLPFFLVAHLAVRTLNLFGVNIPPDGFSFPYQYSVTFGTLIYVLIGLYLCLKITGTYFERKISFLSTMIVFLASSLIYYSLIEASMSHGLSFFIVTVLLYHSLFHRDEDKPLYWLLVGVFGGLAFLTRYQNIAFLIFPAYFAFVHLIKIGRKLDIKRIISFLRNVLLGVVFLAVTVFPQLLFWKVLYGRFIWGQEVVPMSFLSTNFYFTLFSTWRGLFILTPITLLGTIGIFFLIRKDKNTALGLILCYFFQVYLTSVFFATCFKYSIGIGHAFGPRRLINCTPIFIVGLAALLHWLFARFPKSKVYVKSLLIIIVVWNMLFVIQYKLNFITSSGYLTFKEMVLDKFTLPFKLIEYIKDKF